MTISILAPITQSAFIENTTHGIHVNELPIWAHHPLPFFSEVAVSFLHSFSRMLMQDKACKNVSELVALAFWLRQANINNYRPKASEHYYKALGTLVHFTPSNVDTMFVYSWACALLAGNKSIIRVSSRDSNVQRQLFKVLNELLQKPEYQEISRTNLFITYDHSSPLGSHITHHLCGKADGRVLWGGDKSVNSLRAIPCPPRCRDISFSDRVSISIIDADAVSTDSEAYTALHGLLTSVQVYNQQACSSPRMLFWVGDSDSLDRFLSRLHQDEMVKLSNQYDPVITQRNEQLVAAQSLQLSHPNARVNYYADLCAVELEAIGSEDLRFHSGHQVVLCQCVSSLDSIARQITPNVQTLSYFGVSKAALIKFIEAPSITGIDRIVPLSEALNFAPEWDGYELFSQMARRVVIK